MSTRWCAAAARRELIVTKGWGLQYPPSVSCAPRRGPASIATGSESCAVSRFSETSVSAVDTSKSTSSGTSDDGESGVASDTTSSCPTRAVCPDRSVNYVPGLDLSPTPSKTTPTASPTRSSTCFAKPRSARPSTAPPDPEAIPERNIERLEKLGRDAAYGRLRPANMWDIGG
jgi:hypothetical protein